MGSGRPTNSQNDIQILTASKIPVNMSIKHFDDGLRMPSCPGMLESPQARINEA